MGRMWVRLSEEEGPRITAHGPGRCCEKGKLGLCC